MSIKFNPSIQQRSSNMARVRMKTPPHDEERIEYSCPLKECTMEFKHHKLSKVLKHFKRIHPSEWILKCGKCKSYLSTSVKRMAKHIAIKCEAINPEYHHSSCRSSTKLNYYKFQKAVFPLQYRCTECKFTTDSFSDFNIHFENNCSTNSSINIINTAIKTEPDSEPEPSPQSMKPKSKKFVSLKEDKGLIWPEEEERTIDPEDVARRAIHPCPVCGKCFTRRRSIKPHMVVHTNERVFDCHICPYKARRKGDLSLHISKVHNQERPYSCTYCSKQFGFKTNLTRHLRIHTGSRPFKCDECGKTFRRKHSVPKHQALYHRVRGKVEM